MPVTEIAPDLYRISTYVPEIDLQFNQFLIKDDEPLLFHTGIKAMFPIVRDAVASVIDPSSIRWIGFSHFEADECGSLNEWLQTAPAAQAVSSLVGAMVSVNDFALRPARGMTDGEVIEHRQVPLPVPSDTPRTALLGGGASVRRDEWHATLLRPVSPEREC